MNNVDNFREMVRSRLVHAAKYNIIFEGELAKDTPEILAFYPHNEHANSLLFPLSANIVYLAARDHFYKNPFNFLLANFVARSIPITREKSEQSRDRSNKEMARIGDVFDKGMKLGIYPQGSRSQGLVANPIEFSDSLQKKRGAAFFSKEFGIPVRPIGIDYKSPYQPIKGGDSGEKRIFRRLLGKKIEPVDVVVRIGQALPPLEGRKSTRVYMAELSLILWSLVHGSFRQVEDPII
jgi:1-acyl-sn-glycerol-3-phosphate acyltransferase